MLSHVCLDSMPASEALDLAKQVSREAATATRDHCFAHEEQSLQVRLVRLSSVGRAVWAGDLKLGNRVYQGSTFGFEHLNVSGPWPVLVSPSEFEIEFAEAKRAHLNSEKLAISKLVSNSDNKKAYAKRKLKESDRKSALLRPVCPYFPVVTLRVDETLGSRIGFSQCS